MVTKTTYHTATSNPAILLGLGLMAEDLSIFVFLSQFCCFGCVRGEYAGLSFAGVMFSVLYILPNCLLCAKGRIHLVDVRSARVFWSWWAGWPESLCNFHP
jgi:hypothetical protein